MEGRGKDFGGGGVSLVRSWKEERDKKENEIEGQMLRRSISRSRGGRW